MQQQIPNNSGVVKDEISLKEMILSIQAWWKYIRSKWKVVILVGLFGGAVGLTCSVLVPTQYLASTLFVLDNANDNDGYASVVAKFGLGGSTGEGLFTDEDNIITFLESRAMIVQTLLTFVEFNGKKELLIDRYLDIYSYKTKWNLKDHIFRPFPEENTRFADSLLSLVHKRIVKKNLSAVKPDKERNLINVTVSSTDQLFSKSFADNLIYNATDFYSKTITQKSLQNVKILQHQVDSIKELLNIAIASVAIGTDAVPNLNPAYQRLKVPSQRNIVDVEMNKAILQQLVTNLELAKIDLRKETPLIQIIDRPVLPLEKKKIGRLKGTIFGITIAVGLITLFFSIKLYLKKVLS